MSYVIINPVNMTYDGGYSSKAHAEEMLHYCRTKYKQPATFMAYIDGVPSDVMEPHFKWMADVEPMSKYVAVVPYGNEGSKPLNKDSCPLFVADGCEVACVSSSGDSLCSGFWGHVSGDVIECQERSE